MIFTMINDDQKLMIVDIVNWLNSFHFYLTSRVVITNKIIVEWYEYYDKN